MLDNICEENHIINSIFQKTAITKTQLDTLLSNVEGKRRVLFPQITYLQA